MAAARRRSFHLSPNPTALARPLPVVLNPTSAHNADSARPPAMLKLNPQRLQPIEVGAGLLSTHLLDLARQASAFAFALLGGCAPGVRVKKTSGKGKEKEIGMKEGMGMELELGMEKEETKWRALMAGMETPATAEVAEVKLELETREPVRPNEALEHSPERFHGQEDEQLKRPDLEETADSPIEAAVVDAPVRSPEPVIQVDVAAVEPEVLERIAADVQPDEDFSEPEQPPSPLPEPAQIEEISDSAVEPQANVSPPPIGLGLLFPSPTTNELRLLSPLESRRESPKPEPAPFRAKLRVDLVRRVAAFTAARLARDASVSPPVGPASLIPMLATPPRPGMHFDSDPFADTPRASAAVSFVPAHPAALDFPSLQRVRPEQQQSPTPAHPRTGRPPLRQQTVFFKQRAASSTPPEYWTPHPAASRSSAIIIKAPAGTTPKRRVAADKENWQAI
ncbi:hypothetical protein C8R46DRAFT_1216103 [Mycena filopes]|nr:hypothetical protein C8R46DRAFT_1216103 [Mycena filopes]